MKHLSVVVFALGLPIVPLAVPAHAQNFGSAVQRKKVVLLRKLPPAGHIDGSTFKVVVTGTGMPPDLALNIKSMLESILVKNDPRLRPVEDKPDAIINCRITTFAQPAPTTVTEQGIAFGKKGGPLQSQQMTRVTGQLTTSFSAQDLSSGRSIAADTVNSKFEQEYPPATSQQGKVASVSHLMGHLPGIPGVPSMPSKSQETDESKPPTPAELRDRLTKDTAQQIASTLVNTTEDVDVFLARGGGLDDADTLIEQKLYSRALEALETMPPFPAPEDDAYRIYNLGVVNEALAYQAEDVQKARKFLQEASIDYGKALDARQSEKLFLGPQTRIDTALAHYKLLGDRSNAIQAAAAAAAAPTPAAPAADAITNDDVIAMVAAKLDDANILDTIQHAAAVKFDLTPKGQIALAKAGVKGNIISAMQARSRKP